MFNREGSVFKGGECCIGMGVFIGSGVFYKEGCCIGRVLFYREGSVV